MKRVLIIGVLVFFGLLARGQAPHLFEHTYPVVHQEDTDIRNLMDRVSIDSLEATIEHMQSYHNRLWNTTNVYQVQDWLYGKYIGMGFDSVYLQDFQFVFHDTLRETSDNVIAMQLGVRYPDEYVVIGAHYDSFNNSGGNPDEMRAPGADDNASGVAGVMEIARLLKPCSFERSILYCGWAAEEVGLKGSEAFAQDCAARQVDIVGYFNLDMIGYLKEGSNIHVHLLYTTQDSTIANYVFNLSKVYFPEMPIGQNWLPLGDSDYSSFNRSGYAAVHTFEDTHHSSPFIHSVNDLLGVSVNNMDQAKRFTELNLGLVATLAGLVSNGVDDLAETGFTVFPNPASETLMVKGLPMKEVAIYNLMGQQVVSQAVVGEECGIEVGSLVSGIYFVRVESEDGKLFIQKFVKE